MKKIGLTLFGLTALMSVTGCKAASETIKAQSLSDANYKVPAEKLIFNYKSYSLRIGESIDLDVEIRPFAAFDTELSFESSNPEVATVDENGVVEGLSGGHATIMVYADNFKDEQTTPDLFEKCEIYVYKKGNFMEKYALLTEMQQYQTDHCEEVDNLLLYDYRIYDLVCEGVSQTRQEEKQLYATSVSKGLISYDSFETDVYTTNGAKSYSNYGYTFQTKSSYGSYAYHRNDNVKNMFYIATEFNLGLVSRFDTACAVVDAFFSVNHDYFTGGYEDVFSTDWFGLFSRYSNLVSKFGSYRTDDEFCISYTLSQEYDDELSPEDELRYATQLPTGIETHVVESLTFTWVNGYLTDYCVKSYSSFVMDGKNYQYNIDLSKHFEIVSDEKINKYVPNDSEYNSVEYYYDI